MRAVTTPSFEFCLLGRAVSGQASSRNRQRWQQEIEAAIGARITDTIEHMFLIQETVAVMIIIASQVEIDIDLDNLAKPILDAMKQTLYRDDSLISRLMIERFPDGDAPDADLIGQVLAEGLEALVSGEPQRQLLYVRVDDYASVRRER